MKHKLAIIGASGYTGAELIRLIETHPKMEVTFRSPIDYSYVLFLWSKT